MKVLSLFSGIGAFEKALTNMGVNYDLVNYCEIDKYASKSYSAIHGVPESKNLGDITKVDTSKLPKNIDLLSYGFPCQDISLAGHQRGFEHEGERTRSGLFFEALRLIEDLQPKVAICENVKNLTSKKFSKEFQIVLESLEEAGYKNYWKVLNAKDYGIPQNRERVFVISIREDIDKGYEFPEPFPLKLRLKDMLDEVVDEKYYLSGKAIDYVCATGTKNFYYKPEIDLEVARPLTSTMHKQHRASQDNYVSDSFINDDVKINIESNDHRTLEVEAKENYVQWDSSGKGYNSQQDRAYYQDGLAPTLSHCNTNGDKSQVVLADKNKVILVGNVNPSGRGQNGSVIDSEGLARTITQEKGEGQKILVKEATKKGYSEAHEGDSINLEQPNSKTRRGRVGVGVGVAQTITTSPQQATVLPELRIRKLTPLECYRLMGFSDEDFYRAEKVNSNTQLYKQAGNSIVVDVIEEIYEELFSLYWNEVK